MGSIISSIVDPKLEEENEAITALGELAQSKAEIMLMEIENDFLSSGTKQNLEIPPKFILDRMVETHAVKKDTLDKNLVSTVQSAMHGFVGAANTSDKSKKANMVVDGVTNVVSAGLKAFLGESSSATGTMQKYYVLVDNLSLVRLDLRGWYRNTEATKIKSKMEKVTAFVMVKSSIDVLKLDINTFMAAYANTLHQMYMHQIESSGGELTMELINQMLDDAEKVYNKFMRENRLHQSGQEVIEMSRSGAPK